MWHRLSRLQFPRGGSILAWNQRSLFIRIEDTPNENSLIFKPGEPVTAGPIVEFRTPLQAQRRSNLADDLFRIEGVTGLLFGRDFITVNKSEDIDWQHLKPAIFATITEHYSLGRPVLKDAALGEGEEVGEPEGRGESADAVSSSHSPEDAEVVAMIKEILDTRIRLTVQDDGGDVQFMGYRDGTVSLLLRGACRSCSSSTITLKHGIENMLMHYIPEVRQVKQVDDPLETGSQTYFEQVEQQRREREGIEEENDNDGKGQK